MSQATVERQAWAPKFAKALEQDKLLPLLDQMLAQLHSQAEKSKC